MWRPYPAILIALSLLLIYSPVGRCRELRRTARPSDNAEASGEQTQATQPPQSNQPRSQNGSQLKPAPPDRRIEKLKRTVRKIGIASKLTAYLNNGDELHGDLTQIDEDSFQMTEVDVHQVFTIQYKNVKKIRSGYGGINLFTGKRTNPSRGLKIGAHAGLLFFIVAFPLIILATSKD